MNTRPVVLTIPGFLPAAYGLVKILDARQNGQHATPGELWLFELGAGLTLMGLSWFVVNRVRQG